jgi:hypothetical protein
MNTCWWTVLGERAIAQRRAAEAIDVAAVEPHDLAQRGRDVAVAHELEHLVIERRGSRVPRPPPRPTTELET